MTMPRQIFDKIAVFSQHKVKPKISSALRRCLDKINDGKGKDERNAYCDRMIAERDQLSDMEWVWRMTEAQCRFPTSPLVKPKYVGLVQVFDGYPWAIQRRTFAWGNLLVKGETSDKDLLILGGLTDYHPIHPDVEGTLNEDHFCSNLAWAIGKLLRKQVAKELGYLEQYKEQIKYHPNLYGEPVETENPFVV